MSQTAEHWKILLKKIIKFLNISITIGDCTKGPNFIICLVNCINIALQIQDVSNHFLPSQFFKLQ